MSLVPRRSRTLLMKCGPDFFCRKSSLCVWPQSNSFESERARPVLPASMEAE